MPRKELSPPAAFDHSIEAGNLNEAWIYAQEFRVSLDRALALTMLMARHEDPRFEAAARRFLIRFIREIGPTIEQVKRVADLLHCLRHDDDLHPLGEGPRAALESLGEQIKRQY